MSGRQSKNKRACIKARIRPPQNDDSGVQYKWGSARLMGADSFFKWGDFCVIDPLSAPYLLSCTHALPPEVKSTFRFESKGNRNIALFSNVALSKCRFLVRYYHN